MAETFLVLRTNDTSPQLYFHNGVTIDPTGLGALPGAALESLGGLAGSNRDLIKQNNRVFTLLDEIFVIQDGQIYKSTDEAATFLSDFTFTGAGTNYRIQVIGPVPVMVLGALKLVGFYMDSTSGNVFVFEYDVAAGTWSDANTGISYGLSAQAQSGSTVPVVYNGLVYARCGSAYIAYDPVSTGTVTLTSTGLTNFGSDQLIAWNGGLWLGPIGDAGVNAGIAKLSGGTWSVNSNGVDLGAAAAVEDAAKAGIFVDPNTGNLIVMMRTTGAFLVYRVTPGLTVTDITGTVVGVALASLGTSVNTRIWPHITRSPGGNYTVNLYATAGGNTTDAVQRFTWVDDATQITELGVVGGTGDMAFPYSIHGGDYNGFFPGEKRVVQTAEASSASGITVTCQAFQDGGTTLSVRGHYDNTAANANNLTLDPMTLSNPLGTGGLSVSGVNPGAQVDGVPANRTPITFDWDQVTDGFTTGDGFSYQLEAL